MEVARWPDQRIIRLCYQISNKASHALEHQLSYLDTAVCPGLQAVMPFHAMPCRGTVLSQGPT